MKQNQAISIKFLLALCVFTLSAASGCRSLSAGGESQPSLPAPTAQTPIVLGDGARASYADVVERVAPAVVNITALHRNPDKQSNFQHPPVDGRRLPDFFDQPQPQPQPQPRNSIERGVGSGVIVNSNGTVLTNNHVVEGASDIEIQLNDNRTFKARIIGADAPSDLAVIKVEANNLPFLNLGDSDKTRVGDVVLALGNPLGIGQTVTLGIISAKGRRTDIGSGTSFEDFLQTDAPINRGNSGGALVNLTGELIGINSQILSAGGGGGSIGIGFAIPSNMARNVSEQLIKNGKVRRGMLGVEIRDAAQFSEQLNLKENRGAVIQTVRANSPAERAGIKRYDVVTQVNNEPVADGNTLRNRIAAMQPGAEATLTVNRNGETKQLKVKLDELTDQAAVNQREKSDDNPKGDAPDQPESDAQNGKLGLGLQPLTPELAKRFQLKGDKGLLVMDVDPDGPAAEAGIQQGDVVLEVNRQSVNSFNEVQNALQAAGDHAVLLLISRRGQTIFMTVEQRQ